MLYLKTILEGINKPQDLRKLSYEQIKLLAKEIRHFLICSVSKTGGHLAPSLGVVELTLAIHKVFNSPVDKIVWDVGHQSYVHKILTGRRNEFCTLRQFGGISGFPKISESAHDIFGTGHSSTSISAALGIALARDIAGDKESVIAVIGDGSLTGGQAYEALNHAGHSGTNMIVILNDNEMSIAKNVGAISEYLSKMRTEPKYTKVKQDIEFLLRRIPAIGDSVAKTVERVKDSLRYLLVPGVLFEELGFNYIGPIDGHNFELLSEVLEKAKKMQGPILIHVLTCKGKGYKPAECNPDKYHGVGPYCIETGEVVKNGDTPTYTSVFGEVLLNLAKQDSRIVAITAAMPEGTGLKKFANQFPKRFFDVGIAEQNAVTMAAGMATKGMRPVVALYSTFAQRAYDQILHDICLQKLPVIFALDRAGIVGEDGPTHHGLFDYSYLRHIPNLTIMAPKDEDELRHMMFTAVKMDSPVAIRYPRGSGLGVPMDKPLQPLTIGEAEELKGGADVVFLAVGSMIEPCIAAREILASEGIEVGVVNARFVKPLDEQMLRKLSRDVRIIITVEENILAGGFGSAVLEYLNAQNLHGVKVLRLGFPDQFIEQGTRSQIFKKYGLHAEGIASAASSFVHRFGVR
ncbi:MAG: 1-deoxy-D-xylulose-5-phosphate synthase [Pelosinus sp.]|nr:1-deoxy-D-xylulose-5-phosphate synthase [Pelosinus sp.]